MGGHNRSAAAMILSTLGVLFMMAMAFGVLMPRSYSLFFGVACFILAGLARRLGRHG